MYTNKQGFNRQYFIITKTKLGLSLNQYKTSKTLIQFLYKGANTSILDIILP